MQRFVPSVDSRFATSSVTMLSELWHRSFVSGGETQRLHTALSDPIPVFIARCALSSFSEMNKRWRLSAEP